jgi:hypothetical protein
MSSSAISSKILTSVVKGYYCQLEATCSIDFPVERLIYENSIASVCLFQEEVNDDPVIA